MPKCEVIFGVHAYLREPLTRLPKIPSDLILSTGLQISKYINVDDTGARHKGKNSYCTHIGNEYFAWFESTPKKNRINFPEILRAEHTDYVISSDATEYMDVHGLPDYQLARFMHIKGETFNDREQRKR